MSHKGRLYNFALALGLVALAACPATTLAGATSRQGALTLSPGQPATHVSPHLRSSAAPRLVAPRDITVPNGSATTSCSRLSAVGRGTPGQYAAVRVYVGSIASGTPLIDSYTDETSQGAPAYYAPIGSDGTFHVEATFAAQPPGTTIQYRIYGAPLNTYNSYDDGSYFETTVACTQDPATPAAQTATAQAAAAQTVTAQAAAAQTAAAQTASAIPTSTSTTSATSTSTPTSVATNTPVPTATPSPTSAATPSATPTSAAAPSTTPTTTNTATPSDTPSATPTNTATPNSGGGTGTGNVFGPVINVSGNGNVVVVVINYNGVATGNGVVIAGPAGALPPTATPTGTPTAATLSRTPIPTGTPPAARPTGTSVRGNAPATAHGYASHGVVVGGGTLLVRLRAPRGVLTPGAPVSLTVELVAAPASGANAARAARAVLYRATVRARSARDGLLRARVRISYAPGRAVAATLIVRVRTPRGLLISRTAVMVVPAR